MTAFIDRVFTYAEDRDYFANGYLGALGFTVLMGLGAGPRLMQSIVVGAAGLAGANLFLKSSQEEQSPLTKGEVGLGIAYASGKLLLGFEAAKTLLGQLIKEGVLDEIRNSGSLTYAKNFTLQKYSGAAYDCFNNELWVPEKFKGTHGDMHERVHAFWRNLRVGTFGAKAQLNFYAYYQNSYFLYGKSQLSWFSSAVEAFVETVTVLKTLFVQKNKVFGAISSLKFGLAWACYAAILALPVAFLFDHAWEGYQRVFGKRRE